MAPSSDLVALLDLCRHDLGIARAQTFEGVPDADALVELAASHRLVAVAERSWTALAGRGRAPPPPPRLRAAAARARQRSLFAAVHLARLGAAFAAAGVTWRALKGPALSLQLHRDATLRTVRDLDVIVPPPQLDAAVAAATGAGWDAPRSWRTLMNVTGRYEIELKPTLAGQPLLELHVALGPRFVQFGLDPFTPDVGGHVVLSDVAIPTLAGAAQAVYVAWHGARGHWYRLAWLFDLARLLPRDEDGARRLLAVAEACEAEAALRTGASFAQKLFGIDAPPWPAASVPAAARVAAMLRWSEERLSLGVDAPSVWSPPGSHRWLWREVAQQPRRWRAVAGALDQLTRPTGRDAEALGLGLPLTAHRAARPFFIARRWLARGG